MLKCLEHLDAIYVACGPTDLRKNVDGLSILVKQSFGLDPFSRSLFLFCNGSRNRLKGLVWDRNGFILLYKRLDGAGARFVWPTDPVQVRNISRQQMDQLLNGFSIDPPKGFSEITARDIY